MTRKTHGGKGDRIPGADQAAYEENYAAIDWNARGEHQPATPPVLHGQVEEEAGDPAKQASVVLDVRADGASGGSDHR